MDKNTPTIEESLAQIAHYFSFRPEGFYSTVGRIDQKLGSLVEKIDEANTSSAKLTEALNKITLAGVVISGIGILIAFFNLAVEIYKLAVK